MRRRLQTRSRVDIRVYVDVSGSIDVEYASAAGRCHRGGRAAIQRDRALNIVGGGRSETQGGDIDGELSAIERSEPGRCVLVWPVEINSTRRFQCADGECVERIDRYFIRK